MGVAILLFIICVCSFTFMLKYNIILVGKIAGRQIERTHKAAEAILNTKRPPKEWIEKWERKMDTARDVPNREAEAERIKMRAKKDSVRRLDSLIGYFRATSLMEDEETRLILLEELRKIRRLWNDNWDWEFLRGGNQENPQSSPVAPSIYSG